MVFHCIFLLQDFLLSDQFKNQFPNPIGAIASNLKNSMIKAHYKVEQKNGNSGANSDWPHWRAACVFSDAGNVLWDKPLGLKAFGNTPEKAAMTKVMAQNQGLYNGFLAAGLFWALTLQDSFFVQVATFFLGCVLVVGIFGAITASRKILYIQAMPALIALIVLYAAR